MQKVNILMCLDLNDKGLVMRKFYFWLTTRLDLNQASPLQRRLNSDILHILHAISLFII